MTGGRERTAEVTLWLYCDHKFFSFFLRGMMDMHLESIKDNTNQSRSDLFPLWSLEVGDRVSGVQGGSGFSCLTSGVIRLMVGKSYPAPRKFGA